MKKLVLVLLFSLSQGISAYESDQHTVPDQELADVGTDMSTFIYHQVNVAVTKINIDIKELPAKIEADTAALTESLFSWHGMDYGHRSDDLLRLDALCF